MQMAVASAAEATLDLTLATIRLEPVVIALCRGYFLLPSTQSFPNTGRLPIQRAVGNNEVSFALLT